MSKFCFLCIVRLFVAGSFLLALMPQTAEARFGDRLRARRASRLQNTSFSNFVDPSASQGVAASQAVSITPSQDTKVTVDVPAAQSSASETRSSSSKPVYHEVSYQPPAESEDSAAPAETKRERAVAEEKEAPDYQTRVVDDYFQYKMANGRWNNAQRFQIVKQAGTVPGTDIATAPGEYLYLRQDGKWEKAPADTHVVPMKPSDETVPNPWGVEIDPYYKEVVHYTNIWRMKNLLTPYKVDPTLISQAEEKSKNVAAAAGWRYMFWNGQRFPVGGDVSQGHHNLAPHYGNNRENIANGNMTAKALVDMWYNSPGHQSAMLDANKTTLGVGSATGNYGMRYHTQIMGSRAAPVVQTSETKTTSSKKDEKSG